MEARPKVPSNNEILSALAPTFPTSLGSYWAPDNYDIFDGSTAYDDPKIPDLYRLDELPLHLSIRN